MAIYKVCNKCNKVTEVIKTTTFDGGYETIQYICSKCGYIDKEQINHIHYGNDAIKK